MSNCCKPTSSPDKACKVRSRPDFWLWLPLTTVVLLYLLHIYIPISHSPLDQVSQSVFEMLNTMALGLVIGVVMVAGLSYVPRELVVCALGPGYGAAGIFRATLAGVLLDLCSHGILMVGAKLYERGVSVGQVMAFLIASPWNSLSLTIILIAFIGVGWTLVFIAASVIIAVIAGYGFNYLVGRGVLPMNPNTLELPRGYQFWPQLLLVLKSASLSPGAIYRFLKTGMVESRTVVRWLLIGVLLASLIRTFVAQDVFSSYFGPTLLGLLFTMLAATIIEVCSEGAAPIAADLFNRAYAPGNAFAFLMAGVATDYTEVMVLQSTTRSWKIALFLPLLTLPQIIILAVLMNAV